MVFCSEASTGFPSQSKAHVLTNGWQGPMSSLYLPFRVSSILPPLFTVFQDCFFKNMPSLISSQGFPIFCAFCLEHFPHMLVPWSLLRFCPNVTFAWGVLWPPILHIHYSRLCFIFLHSTYHLFIFTYTFLLCCISHLLRKGRGFVSFLKFLC